MIRYILIALIGLILVAIFMPSQVLVYTIATGKVNLVASAIVMTIEAYVIGWVAYKTVTEYKAGN